jgi:N-acetylneuraminate synthase
MKQTFAVYGKEIGQSARCFVIAEAGSNHNGSRDTALKLIEAAADAGADAVKFQTFEARRLYPKSAGQSDYLRDETPIFDIIKAMEMPHEWLPLLRDHAHQRGLAFISSPFHEEAVELLDPFVDAFKIASYELTHEPLLKAVAARKKPVFLSTGAATTDEAKAAARALEAAGCDELVVFQCTASYPTPPEAANVRALVTLREALGVPTGLSDHTRDPCVAPMVAVALGAAAIEKHFTLSNRLPGPDHAFAVEPDELALLVRRVRDVEAVLGSGSKEVHAVEQELRGFARRSIFSTRPISRGERFTRDNVDVLRQGKLGSGLPPAALERVLSSVAARDVAAEVPLCDEDLV